MTISRDRSLLSVQAPKADANPDCIQESIAIALHPESKSHQLDWGRISSYLRHRGIALDTRFAPRQLAGGLANLNYIVRIDEHWAVLRRPPPGPVPPGANDMRREHRILSSLWRQLPLAPRSFHLCEDEAIAGAPFQLMEFRPGISIKGASLDPLPETPDVAKLLTDMMIDTLDSVHAVNVGAIGLEDLGRPEGFFRRTCAGWMKRAALAAGPESRTAVEEIGRWLVEVSEPDPGLPVLLHNDFKLDNILIDKDDLSAVALLDWDMGTRGDALLDLATLLSYWTEPGDPDCMFELAQMPTAKPGFPSREAVANAYSEKTGRSVEDLKPYRVLAIFKLGIVFHQLHSRFVNGEAVDPKYQGFGRLADEILQFCIEVQRDRIF